MVYVFSQDQGVTCEKPSQSTTTSKRAILRYVSMLDMCVSQFVISRIYLVITPAWTILTPSSLSQLHLVVK